MLKPLVSSINVDAVYINGKYQDETKQLILNEDDISTYQCSIQLHTKDNREINVCFHSSKDLCDFIKAYELEKWDNYYYGLDKG